MSPETASSLLNSLDTAFNSSSARPGMIHQVLVATSIDLEGNQLVDLVVRNAPEIGPTIACWQ